ncbi:family 20 glycosylhydrolase [Aquimarina sediminis]|uniref:family 20 glycosylhydrolase n=1 Tax=Aquimarina sediminis TaxID=2070536 RepID=UPI000CA00F3D|nr:family 20 glycosylhydrolase [Aquimarina sediminis]
MKRKLLFCLLFLTIVTTTLFAQSLDSNYIIPRPYQVNSTNKLFSLLPTSAIHVQGSEKSKSIGIATIFRNRLRPSTGYTIPIYSNGERIQTGSIVLSLNGSYDSNLGDEGYKLTIGETRITLVANKAAGLFYGTQSLLQLLPSSILKKTVHDATWVIPTGTIIDNPQYGHRGNMLDIARHFFTPAVIKRQIDLMAMYKMNVLHLHLSDDQGWRIEIKSWPNLALIGGSTEVGGGPGGYLTQEEYRDIVQYANDRFITIIPEIDMPGHINAALASYGELNCDNQPKSLYTGTAVGFSTLCADEQNIIKPEVLDFMRDVIRELADMTTGPFIHVGGDEVPTSTLPREAFLNFVNELERIVQANGKKMIGWTEISFSELDSETIVQNWKSGGGKIEGAVEQGSKIIMSPQSNIYLDYSYSRSDVQHSYSWNPTTIQAFKGIKPEQIVGVESALWTERTETEDQIDFRTYPRLVGVAEVGWSDASLNNWDEYKERLGFHKNRFENLEVNYYESPLVVWKDDLNPPIPCTSSNNIIMERYDNIEGSSISDLLNAPNYPERPTSVVYLDRFHIPVNKGDNYGAKLSGYFIAPETGAYHFWVTGDDNVELNLSLDGLPKNKNRIAYHNGHAAAGDWNKYSTQKSEAISLVAGNRYYIEALLKEKSGADILSVGWLKPGDENRNTPSEVIPCHVFTERPGCSEDSILTMERYNNISGLAISDLLNSSNYPDKPSSVNSLTQFDIPRNSGDNYGVRVRGYLSAPKTGIYYFWVAGDDHAELNLSIDASPRNKKRIAYHNHWTNYKQWNKYDTQKSEGIKLVAGEIYYIEALMKEASGGDNLTIGWRKPGNGDGSVPVEVIPIDAFTHRPQGFLTMERYDNINGISILDLLNASNFPDNPSSVTTLDNFDIPLDAGDNYGVRVSGYIAAPETGNYYFWVAGDDHVELNLSSNSFSGNKKRIAYHSRWTNYKEWNKYPSQKSNAVNLKAGEVYYIEALMKEGGRNDNLTVGWRKPSDGHASTPKEVVPCSILVQKPRGILTMERYDNINGITISDLLNAPNFPDNPSSKITLNNFDIPQGAGDNYGARVSGYLSAPETGTYYFWVAGDDHVELSLSTDSSVENKRKIAHHTRWTNHKQWDKFETQKSIGIHLVAGQVYYLEALLKEGGLNDNLSVGWRKPSQGNGSIPVEVIPASAFTSEMPVASKTVERNILVNTTENIESEFDFSQNPAKDKVSIEVYNLNESKALEYNIYTLSGRLIYSDTGNSKKVIDLRGFNKGMYIVTVKFDNSTLFKKLIIR